MAPVIPNLYFLIGWKYSRRPGNPYTAPSGTMTIAPEGSPVPCCADIEDGAVTTLSEAVVAGNGKLAFSAPAWSPLRSGAARADARHPPGIPIAAASFYARTARVRR